MSTDIQQHPLHVSHIQGQAGKEQQLYDEKLSQETAEEQVTHYGPDNNNEEIRQMKRIDGEVMNDPSRYSDTQPTESEELLTTINKLQDDTKSFFAKWLEELSPSEDFELLCPSRVDQLLKEAYSLEQALEEHKIGIKNKLSTLSDVLKLSK